MSSSSRECTTIKSPPPIIKQEKIEEPHSTVSVVRYNSEIELSTDTDDSASETTATTSHLTKIEEALKTLDNDDVRLKVLEYVRQMANEHETLTRDGIDKDNKISQLEARIAELEGKLQATAVVKVNGETTEVNCCASTDMLEETATSQQTSVIASGVEQKAIVMTASEWLSECSCF